jgi:predicted ribosome quality control (RQC) complex YloA/Tae2 family protein
MFVMEGLLIAEVLRRLSPLLPSSRLSWRFPDPYTFVLPLRRGALWLYNKPPNAQIALRDEVPPVGGTHTGFQDLLVARAGGPLESAEQFGLDRALKLTFGATEGFVETPPVTLVAELTGRNCNLILTDEAGTILGVAREVTREINRFRQLRPGLPYRPPPPYDKRDPRALTDEELVAALADRPLSALRKHLDGVGPELTAALARALGVPRDRPLVGDEVARAGALVRRLTVEPSRVLEELGSRPDLAELRAQEAQQARLAKLRSALQKRRNLVHRRLGDLNQVFEAALEVDALRAEADLLLAYAHQVPAGASEVMLMDFSGEPRGIKLEPRLSAVENAQTRYERAKKRLARLEGAEAREAALHEELRTLEVLLARLEALSEDELGALEARYLTKPKAQNRAAPGTRYLSPQGFEVWVGRNARGNDELTFKLAKSRDVWLHAQGYPGSHVIIRAENREVPFETILFAAQLAAAYSRAGDSDNVAVDYTLKKHVWKPKGAPPGAVHFTQQKTVFVTPSRRPEVLGEAANEV